MDSTVAGKPAKSCQESSIILHMFGVSHPGVLLSERRPKHLHLSLNQDHDLFSSWIENESSVSKIFYDVSTEENVIQFSVYPFSM